MNKIIFSRKGYDDQYGSKPSVILPDGTMLSFPIPVSEKESGIQSSGLKFGNKTLSEIFAELGHANSSLNHHVDPDIYQLVGKTPMGAFGQAGAALSHLDNQGISKGDIFLFFGTFCLTNNYSGQLQYEMMHPFHALYGYLVVDRRFTIDDIEKDEELYWLKDHPHYINRGYGDYNKVTNAIYIGKDYGYFRFGEKLRLTKPGYKKSYWQLPLEFQGFELSYHDQSKQRISADFVEFTSVAKGQEFVFERKERLEKWLGDVLKYKVIQ